MSYRVPDDPTPCIVCFGDSQTQYGWGPSGFVARLAETYQRKADVINRGFAGYTTRDAREMLRYFFFHSAKGQKIVGATVWLGCNDSIDPGQKQYVSEEDYAENLKQCAGFIQGWKPPPSGVPLLIIGPTPVTQREFHNNERKVLYTKLAREVAEGLECDFLDAYELFMQSKTPLEQLLDADGLHIAPKGYDLLFDAIIGILKRHKQLNPDEMRSIFPDHKDLSTDPAQIRKQMVPPSADEISDD